MEVIQKFGMHLEGFEGIIFVEVSRSPNMNGFLHSVKHQVPECWHDMRHAYLETARISDREKGLVMDEAARLWDEYWTVGSIEGKNTAQGWREWSNKRNERSKV